jgi:hypothetical protein
LVEYKGWKERTREEKKTKREKMSEVEARREADGK